MAQHLHQTSLPRPSSAQIALALATLRAKPPQLSIEEHLSDIRKCVVSVPSISGVWPSHHIDSGHFWRLAFERSQDEKERIQDEVAKLHQELERHSGIAPPSKKRKKDSPAVTKANTQSKRIRLQDEIENDDGTNNDDFGTEQHLAVRTLLQTIFTLQQHSSSYDGISANTVATNIHLTCNALKTCIDAALPLPEGRATKNVIALQDICPQIVISYKLLLSAVNGIPSNAQDFRALDNAINSLNALFLTFLGNLHKLALDEITRQEGEEISKRRKPKSNTKATKKASEPDQASFTESAALLARTSRRFITSLDMNRTTHCRIFKSVLSALLDHVGSSLSLLVFADPQQLDDADALIEQPCGLQHVAHVDTSTALAVAELEGPYLIFILKPALGHLQQSRLNMPFRSREIVAGSRTDIGNEALLQKIEKRLGDTLLRAVFGDEDQRFREAFSRQASPEDDIAEDTVRDAREEEDKSKWYIGQLWELLGWDMLSGKLAGRE